MVNSMMHEMGWHSVSKKPEDGAKVLTAHYMVSKNTVGRVIYGSAIYSDRSYRNEDSGCLDTPSWWRPINSFYTKESHQVSGRGIVFSVWSPAQFERSLAGFKACFGEKVLINGVEYEPLGIESFCVTRPVAVGEGIGIFVGVTP